jgi:twinkle protein
MSSASGWPLEKFPAGSSKAITIFEGNDDAMSGWQMLGKYPVYAVRSASSALHDVRRDYDYLNAFEKIYLCLDSDEPGQKATKEIASVFGFGKIYLVATAPLKDATEYLEKKREKEFRNLWFNATRYMPDTVVSSFAAIEQEFSKRKDIVRFEWPWASWQRMTGGIEIHRQYVITGLEGTGKTEELHEIAAHLLDKYPDMNLGLVLAEEPVADTVTMQVGKHLRLPIHLDGYRLPDSEVLELYKKRVGREDRVHFFRHFGSEETDALLATIRFMVAACGCRVVMLDNYQHLVTGRTKDRDVEALDYLANRLESLVKELDFALISISHENDNEQARGSRNITKEADVWINVKRDIKNANEYTRNIQHITFNKNRQGQKTGPAGRLIYDVPTATLAELTEELPT